MDRKIKILFLAANPSDTTRLQVDEEARLIGHKLQSTQYRDMLDLVLAPAVRTDDLLPLLNQHKPQIVHFSGHGSTAGEIILKNHLGIRTSVPANTIKSLFKTFKDDVRLVVLNACYSEPQAEAIIENIDCAIGMHRAIGDQAAIIFAAALYSALGSNVSVEDAFDQGRIALSLEGIQEENVPKLLHRKNVKPAQMYILEAARDVGPGAVHRGARNSKPVQLPYVKTVSGNMIEFWSSAGFRVVYPRSLTDRSFEDTSDNLKITIFLNTNRLDSVVFQTFDEYLGKNATLHNVYQDYLQVASELKEFNLISHGSVTLGGEPACQIFYSASTENWGYLKGTQKVLWIFGPHNGRVYSVYYTALATDYDTHLRQAQLIINSFRYT
jgi:hypothetical protein